MASCQQSRSTKGASKQRRDNINSEVSIIRSLLPLPDAVRSRLSQLQVMAMCKAFVGKSNLLCTSANEKSELVSQLWDFTQALPGFLLVTDTSGTIVYMSDNTVEYLGHSMVDIVSQSENVLDIVHPGDKNKFADILNVQENSAGTKTIFCRMGLMKHPRRNQTFDKYKKVKVVSRIQTSPDGSLKYMIAMCTLQMDVSMLSDQFTYIFDSTVFKSTHTPDMRYSSLDENGHFHLGLQKGQVAQMSWYAMIHPNDVAIAVKKHTELMKSNFPAPTVSLSARFQSCNGNIIWLRVVLRRELVENDKEEIVCCNQVMNADEVAYASKFFSHTNLQLENKVYDDESIENVKVSNPLKRDFPADCNEGNKKSERNHLFEKLKKKMKKTADEHNDLSFDLALWPIDNSSTPLRSNINFTDSSFIQSIPEQFSVSNNFPVIKDFQIEDHSSKEILESLQSSKCQNLETEYQININTTQNQHGFNLTENISVLNDFSIDLPLNNSFSDNNFVVGKTFSDSETQNYDIDKLINFDTSTTNQTSNNSLPFKYPSYLDSKTFANPSEASPYSNCSSINFEEYNQSFLKQVDEIKCELFFEDDLMFDINEKKTKNKLSTKSSFPELEVQEVDEYLKLLEEPVQIKSENLELNDFDAFDFFQKPFFNDFSQKNGYERNYVLNDDASVAGLQRCAMAF